MAKAWNNGCKELTVKTNWAILKCILWKWSREMKMLDKELLWFVENCPHFLFRQSFTLYLSKLKREIQRQIWKTCSHPCCNIGCFDIDRMISQIILLVSESFIGVRNWETRKQGNNGTRVYYNWVAEKWGDTRRDIRVQRLYL